MNDQQKLFVEHYLISFDPRAAALHAGYSLRVARGEAFRWVAEPMANPIVFQAIRARLDDALAGSVITKAQIEHHYARIAFADPQDLVEIRMVACRHCYGENHFYQWSDAEYSEACEEAELRNRPLPAWKGGLGYTRSLPPVHDCPDCDGNGMAHQVIKESRDYSPRARALFAGAKINKSGQLEIMMHDQLKALDALTKIKGLFIDRRELSGPDGKPMQLIGKAVDLSQLSPAALEELLNAMPDEPAK